MADERRVKVGFVGLGENGLSHARAHLKYDKSEVVALCDRNPERLEKVGKEFGVGKLYRDEGIFDDPEVEAISIHTGDNDHCEPFLAALKRNKHIFVEKPLANTEDDVRTMVEAAKKADSNLKIQVGYVLRFNPLFYEIHKLVREGKLGHIYYMEADYIHNLLYYPREHWDPMTKSNWCLEHEQPMVGGSHALDLLRWLSGKEVVSAVGYSNHFAFPEMRHDDCQIALYGFSDGAVAKVATLYGPRMARPPYWNLRLYGTEGTIERDQAAISKTDDDVHPAFEPISAECVKGHPYDDEILDWLDAILEDRPTRTGIYDGANSTMATLRACRAMEDKCEVDVPVFHP